MHHTAHHVGSDEGTGGRRLLCRRHLRPLVGRGVEQLLDLVPFAQRHHGPEFGLRLHSRPHAEFGEGRLQSVAELWGQRLVHVEAVGCGARRAAVAHLGDHRPGNSRLHISAFEHHEGGIAAKFHAGGEHPLRGLLEQQLAHIGGTSEGQCPHAIVGEDRRGHLTGTSRGDHIHHAGRRACPQHHLTDPQRGQRRLPRRLEHTGAARGQRWSDLAGGHGSREVPRGDHVGDADGSVIGDDRLVPVGRVAETALHPRGFFSEPAEELRGVEHLAHRVAPRFAVLQGDEPSAGLGFGGHDLKGASEHF